MVTLQLLEMCPHVLICGKIGTHIRRVSAYHRGCRLSLLQRYLYYVVGNCAHGHGSLDGRLVVTFSIACGGQTKL